MDSILSGSWARTTSVGSAGQAAALAFAAEDGAVIAAEINADLLVL
jgi:hypothetical protein